MFPAVPSPSCGCDQHSRSDGWGAHSSSVLFSFGSDEVGKPPPARNAVTRLTGHRLSRFETTKARSRSQLAASHSPNLPSSGFLSAPPLVPWPYRSGDGGRHVCARLPVWHFCLLPCSRNRAVGFITIENPKPRSSRGPELEIYCVAFGFDAWRRWQCKDGESQALRRIFLRSSALRASDCRVGFAGDV